MQWIWDHYLTSPEQRNDWRVAPLRASMQDLPHAHLIVGSLDPLQDDNRALASRLQEAGVPNELTIYEGLTHGFIRYGRLIDTARRAVSECAEALSKALMRPS